MRVQEGFALTRRGEFVQGRQVDGAQGLDLALETVDVGLQSGESDFALLDRACHRLQVGLCLGQLLRVLLDTQSGRLLLELQVGDAQAANPQPSPEVIEILNMDIKQVVRDLDLWQEEFDGLSDAVVELKREIKA